jgi:hypothetical protein
MTQTLLEKLMPCAARGVSVSKKERGECPNLAPMKRTQVGDNAGILHDPIATCDAFSSSCALLGALPDDGFRLPPALLPR